MREWRSGEIRILESRKPCCVELPEMFRSAEAKKARSFHEKIAGYEKTPLVSLAGLAESLHVKGIYVKDESRRFCLNSFKGLGGSYAMFRILCERLSLEPVRASFLDLIEGDFRDTLEKIEFVTCTDGNHGKGVAWAAGLFGCRAHVFMPFGSQEVRAEAIRKAGPAEVEITGLSYDDTVRHAKAMSEKNGWILIQDTAWEGYEKIPAWIIQGYLTLAAEAADDLDAKGILPTHVFLQAGVGAMAGGILGFLAERYRKSKSTAVIVEPCVADCIYRSAKAGDGKTRSVEGASVTIMAGLNCGTPCELTWPVLRDYADFYISIPDSVAADGMRSYAAGLNGDRKIVSGGSGAATLGALMRIMTDGQLSETRSAMGLNADSIVFLINTEGDTDPANYDEIVSNNNLPDIQ